jgi:hypothetical protein
MNALIRQMALSGLLLVSAGAALADVDVKYIQPEKFTDLPKVDWQRQQALDDIAEHFKDLGKTLAPGQDLNIEVLDVDLAGREHPNRFSLDRIRVRDGRGDWPRMHLRYTLTEHGQVVKSGDALLSDKSYMNHINMYPDDERLPFEKQMIDDWWENNLGRHAALASVQHR